MLRLGDDASIDLSKLHDSLSPDRSYPYSYPYPSPYPYRYPYPSPYL